jgi:BlaI family penicillinase repressor
MYRRAYAQLERPGELSPRLNTSPIKKIVIPSAAEGPAFRFSRTFRSEPKNLLTSPTTIVGLQTSIVDTKMTEPKLTNLELKIMEALWSQGHASIREIRETFPAKNRPAYTTIQTTVYRLEAKNAVRRVKKVGNFHIFEAAVSRNAAQRKLIDDLLALFGGRTQPVMAHLIESGKLTLADVKEAEKVLRKLERKDKSQ